MRAYPRAGLTLLGAAALLGQVQAQESATGASLEEIIVTAQKRSQNLQDVPISVTALNGAELAASGIDTQKMLPALTPNMTVGANANFIAPYIRGVGTQYANPGLEPSVATYIDDLYLSRASAGFLSFNDIERIEVLKGPQGTLYGRNTTGGAIRIITKEPTERFSTGAGVTAGNFGRLGGDGYVNGAIAAGLQGRLGVQYDSNDGWVKNMTPGNPRVEDRKYAMARGKLKWDATERLTVKFAGDYTDKNDHEGQAFLPLFPGVPQQVGRALGGQTSADSGTYSGNLPYDNRDRQSMHSEIGGAELRADYEFDGFTLSSISGYRYTQFSGIADLDATTANFLNAATVRELTQDSSQEFQAVSDGSGRLDWVGGVFYFHESAADKFCVSGLAVSGGAAVACGDGRIKIDSIAPYGQVSYKITPQWEVLAGARYTSEKKKLEGNVFTVSPVNADSRPIAPALVTLVSPADEVKPSAFTPKAQVTWRPVDDVMLYLSYAKGFKSGGFNLPQPSDQPPQKVDNETLNAFELGWKTEFGSIRFNGAYFHYEAKDLQVQITDPSAGITSVTNAGSSTTDGIEADLAAVVARGLELGAGIGYQDAKFDSFPGGPINVPCADPRNLLQSVPDAQCVALGGLGLATVATNPDGTRVDLKGNQLPQAPQWSGYVRGAYERPLSGNLGNVGASVIASYTGSFAWTADNLFNEPSKWLLNATLGWKSADGRVGLGAFGTNLTDKDYNTHQAPFSSTGGWRVPAPPRQYGVRASYDF